MAPGRPNQPDLFCVPLVPCGPTVSQYSPCFQCVTMAPCFCDTLQCHNGFMVPQSPEVSPWPLGSMRFCSVTMVAVRGWMRSMSQTPWDAQNACVGSGVGQALVCHGTEPCPHPWPGTAVNHIVGRCSPASDWLSFPSITQQLMLTLTLIGQATRSPT